MILILYPSISNKLDMIELNSHHLSLNKWRKGGFWKLKFPFLWVTVKPDYFVYQIYVFPDLQFEIMTVCWKKQSTFFQKCKKENILRIKLNAWYYVSLHFQLVISW